MRMKMGMKLKRKNLLCCAAALVLASCAQGNSLGAVNVIARESGSGTRTAFGEIVGTVQTDETGAKTDLTTAEAMVCKSTDVTLTQVSGDINAIGYVSYGSVNSSVKTLEIDGILPDDETVDTGDYPIMRDFSVVTSGEISQAAEDFLAYVLSADGQREVTAAKYACALNDAESYEPLAVSGTVTVSGSSSAAPVMQLLADKYSALGGDVTVEIQVTDSSTGLRSLESGGCDIAIISRELTSDEQKYDSAVFARDAIAVIVNPENPVNSLTMDELRAIYTGETTDWLSFTQS